MKHKAKAMECQKGQTPKRVDGSNSEITPKEALITPRALTGLLGKMELATQQKPLSVTQKQKLGSK